MNIQSELGFSDNCKLLIIHADDAGLSHSENLATIQALEQGIVNSYSIMVPCPWFYEMAKFAKNNPQFDSGIHLTLTCEWENYKFGPVLPVSEVKSLVDENGHYYKNRDLLSKNGTAEDVEKELEAQIKKALDFGINATHLDSHMFSVGSNEEFFKIYKGLGRKYGLPVLINKQLMEMVGLDIHGNIEENDISINKAHFGTWEHFENGNLGSYYENVFDDVIAGLNIVLIHPAFHDREMKGITQNHPNFGSEWRQIDFDTFGTHLYKSKLQEKNIELVTWKDLKNVAF